MTENISIAENQQAGENIDMQDNIMEYNEGNVICNSTKDGTSKNRIRIGMADKEPYDARNHKARDNVFNMDHNEPNVTRNMTNSQVHDEDSKNGRQRAGCCQKYNLSPRV